MEKLVGIPIEPVLVGRQGFGNRTVFLAPQNLCAYQLTAGIRRRGWWLWWWETVAAWSSLLSRTRAQSARSDVRQGSMGSVGWVRACLCRMCGVLLLALPGDACVRVRACVCHA